MAIVLGAKGGTFLFAALMIPLSIAGCAGVSSSPVAPPPLTSASPAAQSELPIVGPPWTPIPSEAFDYTMNGEPAIVAAYTTPVNTQEACAALVEGIQQYAKANGIKPNTNDSEFFLEGIMLAISDSERFMSDCTQPQEEERGVTHPNNNRFSGLSSDGSIGGRLVLPGKKPLLLIPDTLEGADLGIELRVDQSQGMGVGFSMRDATEFGNPSDIIVIFATEA